MPNGVWCHPQTYTHMDISEGRRVYLRVDRHGIVWLDIRFHEGRKTAGEVSLPLSGDDADKLKSVVDYAVNNLQEVMRQFDK